MNNDTRYILNEMINLEHTYIDRLAHFLIDDTVRSVCASIIGGERIIGVDRKYRKINHTRYYNCDEYIDACINTYVNKSINHTICVIMSRNQKHTRYSKRNGQRFRGRVNATYYCDYDEYIDAYVNKMVNIKVKRSVNRIIDEFFNNVRSGKMLKNVLRLSPKLKDIFGGI